MAQVRRAWCAGLPRHRFSPPRRVTGDGKENSASGWVWCHPTLTNAPVRLRQANLVIGVTEGNQETQHSDCSLKENQGIALFQW